MAFDYCDDDDNNNNNNYFIADEFVNESQWMLVVIPMHIAFKRQMCRIKTQTYAFQYEQMKWQLQSKGLSGEREKEWKRVKNDATESKQQYIKSTHTQKSNKKRPVDLNDRIGFWITRTSIIDINQGKKIVSRNVWICFENDTLSTLFSSSTSRLVYIPVWVVCPFSSVFVVLFFPNVLQMECEHQCVNLIGAHNMLLLLVLLLSFVFGHAYVVMGIHFPRDFTYDSYI